MPDELDAREVDDKKEIYFKGEWRPVKEQSQKQKKEYPLPVEVKIGNKSLKGHGRADEFKWKDKQGNERIRTTGVGREQRRKRQTDPHRPRRQGV